MSFSAFLALTLALAAPPCLRYEPELVELRGTLRRTTFPGPPNYESVKAGDAPEVIWVLHLPKPICVTPADPKDPDNPPESGIRHLQLNGPDYQKQRGLVGRQVRARGRLVHASTGHHHTPVMLEVVSLEAWR